MTRELTQDGLQATLAEETEKVFLTLLDFDFDGYHVRVVNDGQDVTSDSQTYYAYPFEVSLPSDTEGRPPQARLVIDNVDQTMFDDGSKTGLIAHIRDLTDELPVTMKVVMRDTPSDVEVGPYTLYLREVAYDELVIEGVLAPEAIWDESWPSFDMSPFYCPGLFQPPASDRGAERDPRYEKDALKGYPKDDTQTPILRSD